MHTHGSLRHSLHHSFHRSLRHLGKISRLAAVTTLGFSSAPVLADPSPALDRLNFSVGGYYVDPTFNLSGNTRYGSVNSGDIDRNRTTLPRVRAELLLWDSQGLSFDYFAYRKTYSGTFDRTIPVGNNSSLSGNAEANIEVDLAKFACKWWFGSGNDVFGVGVGAGYYRAHLDANASASLNGTSGSLSESYTEKAFAPLLELGWKHAFSKNLRMYAEASGVKKNWGNLTGHLYNAALGMEWYPLENIGVGADYGITRIKLNRASDNTDANLDIRLKGPSAYLKVRF